MDKKERRSQVPLAREMLLGIYVKQWSCSLAWLILASPASITSTWPACLQQQVMWIGMPEQSYVSVLNSASQDLTKIATPPSKQHSWLCTTTLCPQSFEWNLSSPWNAWDVQKEPSNIVPTTICPSHSRKAHEIEICTAGHGEHTGICICLLFLCTKQLRGFSLKNPYDML